ncbi:MAG: single-stranded DNA-binding protein [Candidatus Daviesbacteria bacterium]|nr:single-stranded DNA-binding protein [Candidatus Daviesbacteria bacterium]
MASRSWNRVELIGNLTRDPELRYTPNGAAVCTFGIATNRTYVSEGERKEEVDFHRLVAWNKLAELCNQLLKKGNRVFISGRLQTRQWEGQDGQSRQVTEIVIEDMILLTPKTVTEEAVPLPEEFPVSKPSAVKEEIAEQKIEEPKVEEESSKKAQEEEKKEPEKPKSTKAESDLAKAESADKTLPQEDVDDLPF